MRVTIVSRIYRPEPAAASIFLGAVADELLRRGDEVDVLTAAPPKGTEEPSRGERVRTLPVLRDAKGYVRGILPYLSFDIPLAFRLLFARRPDVVFMEPPPTTGVVVRVACALRRIPYVYDAADIWSDAAQLEPVSPLVVRALKAMEGFALRGAAHVVTVSQGVVDRTRAFGVRRPVTITGFGADTQEFPVTITAPEQLFVYAGSYSPYHGADILIDGFARFLRTHPGYVLRFIGNGAEQPRVRARADELGIADSIEYVDPVPPAELLPHLGSAAASLATIKPGTVYEYSYASKAFSSMAVGCPVLFAGPGPTIDLIEGANAHVRAGVACAYDAEEIAQALTDLADRRITPPERAELGAWTAEEHSMAAVARRVADVLASVAGKQQAERPGLDDDRGDDRRRAETAPIPVAARATEWLMRRRSSLPGWANRAMEQVARNPDGIIGRLAGRLLRGEDVPPTTVPGTPVRLYISPTNYSGQGYAWARAVEHADPGIGARNVAVELPGGYGFRADTVVPIATVNASAAWAEAEWEAARQFTHVLIEAERSMFGRRFGRDLRAEIAALEEAGASVAFLCHGTDIRDPREHARRTPWSPYPDDPRTSTLQADAEANLTLLTELRRPTFVSTPDLLDDVPWATWCPVVVDAAPFATAEAPFTRAVPRVVHVSSSAAQKGTDLIEPALAELSARGLIDYRLVTGASIEDMPRVYADADIVLDQFRLGSYGVAACEAMAAGRLVVGHVLPGIRDRVTADFGRDLPIVEATPDTLRDVLTGLISDPAAASRIAAQGPGFVSAVHSGAASARILLGGWVRRSG